MPVDAGLAGALSLRDLPAAFERFRVTLASGDSLATRADDWAGCLVLVERGAVEVECAAGGRRSFAAGDLLAPAWLRICMLHNPGTVEVSLLAVHRRGDSRAEGERTT